MNSKQLEAEEFLKTLYSRYFKDHDGNVELRLISLDNKVDHKWLLKGAIPEATWAAITEANTDYHIYFGVNPRQLSRAKKQDDIKDIVCLWADIDSKDFEGGKEEALKAVETFPILPTIIVDSGHGYHLYWVLSEPIIDLKDETRAEFKRILSGVFGEIGADGSKIHLDSCLRLPGTLNIKNGDPTECKLVELKSERTYKLEDFAKFKNADYQEVQEAEGPLPEFGTKTLVISIKDAEAAKADVEKLAIASKTKNLILTGAMLRKKGAKNSRSERDFSIICSLIFSDYDYATIKSIFFSPFLKCSNRIMEKGEATLQQDVRSALGKVKQRSAKPSPQILEIERIKNADLTSDQKRKEIEAFVVGDLLSGPDATGTGFRDPVFLTFYFFDKAGKMLMDLESVDFYCYAKIRYGISKKDFEEVRDGIRAAIWDSKKTAVPHRFAYYDRDKLVLYVTNHDNGIYRLDGEKIELHDNGVDGVYFEYDPTLTPYTYDPKPGVADYFPARTKSGDSIDVALHDLESVRSRFPDGSRPGFSIRKRGIKINIPPLDRSGFSLEQFYKDGCLVKEFLIDRASFTEDEDNPLSPTEQKMFLALFFYSTFFESLLKEKPVACFVGLKESGKSFIATSIGKIFFGDSFESSDLPKSPDDLAVVLGKNHYLVLDNLDAYLKGDMLNLICSAATGVGVKKRWLFTNNVEFKFTPHCFLSITSREPKFKRDDLVSRLLLFHTQKISSPLSRSELVNTLLQKRSNIMTEVLFNLNSIVRLLLFEEAKKSEPGWKPARCISRLADWETLGRVMCGANSGFYFRIAMQVMNEAKDEFAINEDYIYLVLHHICFERKKAFKEMTAADLFQIMVAEAGFMGLRDFDKYYKSPMSMAKKLTHIKAELQREFEIEMFDQANHVRKYSIKGIGVEAKDYDRKADLKEAADRRAGTFMRLLANKKRDEAEEKEGSKYDSDDDNEGDRGD